MGLDMYLMRKRVDAAPDAKLEEIGYWRKAYPIHKWMVDICQDGIDECQLTELSMENLMELEQAASLSLETRLPLIPYVPPFLSGSGEPDERYWRDLEETLKILSKITASDFQNYKYYYQSSW
jgi:hypothetical protein